jgi:hypothetical protein
MAVTADSGDKIRRPGGEFARGSRGETERRGRAFIGRSQGGRSNWEGIEGEAEISPELFWLGSFQWGVTPEG